MKLASLLQPELILCGAKANDYDDAKEKLLARLIDEVDGLDAEPVRQALREREALASTVVAPGIAFPHARTEAAPDFYIAMGTFPDGFAVEGQDEPVRFVTLFLLPEGASNLYLRSMAALARFLAQPETLDALLAFDDADDLIDHVRRKQIMIRDVVTAQDLMTPDPPTARLGATLREVADLMVMQDRTHIPVVDDDGRFVGIVTAARLLRVGLPDYLLSMDSVGFLSEFEPFQELLKQEQSLTVDEIVKKDAPVFPAHTPMIVAASRLVRDDIVCAAVVDADKRLVGTLSVMDFVHKVVRA